MKKLGPGTLKWLKGAHIAFAALWFGGATLLNLKQFFVSAGSDGELYGILSTMVFTDYFIIIPGACGTLLTGVIYSVWSRWGWFKHRWITVKWCICAYGVVFGTYPLGPWLEEMMQMAQEQGFGALSSPVYQHNRLMLMVFGTFQGLTILLAILISTLKPWKRKKTGAPA